MRGALLAAAVVVPPFLLPLAMLGVVAASSSASFALSRAGTRAAAASSSSSPRLLRSSSSAAAAFGTVVPDDVVVRDASSVVASKPRSAFPSPRRRRSAPPSSPGLRPRSRRLSSPSALFASEEGEETKRSPPFKTWSFDGPCDSMDLTEMTSATLSVASASDDDDDDADLILVGVVAAPSDENDDEDEDEEKKEEEVVAPLTGKAKELDDAVLGGALSEAMAENVKEFKNGKVAGKVSPTVRLAGSGSGGAKKTKRYALLGMGQDKKTDDGDEKDDDKDGVAKRHETLTKIGRSIAARCHREKKVSKCSVLFPPSSDVDPSDPEVAKEISTAFHSYLYADNRYRTGDRVKVPAEDLTSVTLVIPEDSAAAEESSEAVEDGKRLASGIFLARDVVNAPRNVLNSESLANLAVRIASESDGRLTCKVLNKEDCEGRGMGAYLGVARGSETEPKFVHLTYTPEGGGAAEKKKVGIVGKGLLFDTGGYNIKTSMMELMKFDCGGAAAVLGAAKATASSAPEGVEAHFIVAACENMISDRAMVPSDVLTASNGMTIEVDNTDAEGRLTLADAIVYADKEIGCESIIELSTLTGACMVSLGKHIAGVWTSSESLASELSDVSDVTGDKSWRMPLATEYDDQLKSKIADVKNCGTRYGGAITAALFLQKFVSKKVDFAHVDIAGPVWNDKTGATGFGTRMATEWVRRQGLKNGGEEEEE